MIELIVPAELVVFRIAILALCILEDLLSHSIDAIPKFLEILLHTTAAKGEFVRLQRPRSFLLLEHSSR